jgi:N-ethylmaleimide reductase
MPATLFDGLTCGELVLANRIVMAPMTRSRAAAGDVPDELHVQYYRQRATAGLIVSEGTQPSPSGKGYCRTPGMHSAAQVAAWRQVTDAVHAAGGRIVMQLMHVGRVASHLNQDPAAEVVAPSAVRAQGQMYTDAQGMVDFDLPRALTTAEIPRVIDEYRQATVNALSAGFDGVELHCTSGYLPMQFLATNTNLRTDDYGGSVHNRIRFVVETLEAMVAAARPGRVGLRICPGNPFNDVLDAAPEETYGALLPAIASLRLAYLHVIRSPLPAIDAFALARRHFKGALIINDGFDGASAAAALAAGLGDAVSFGRHYVSNPDLVHRLKRGAPLAGFDRKTLYTPGARGYTDYPALAT